MCVREGERLGVNFINILRTNVVLAAFSSYLYVVKAAETTFVGKICTFNVDEINTRTVFLRKSVYVLCVCERE